MQSLLQYRRLRAQVEEELARSRQGSRSTSSLKGNSLTGSEKAQEKAQPNGPQRQDTAIDCELDLTTAEGSVLPGVTVSRPNEIDGETVFEVVWPEQDPENPRDWSMSKKWTAIAATCLITAVLTIPTSIEGPTQEAFNAYYGVNDLAGTMTTGAFLIGIAVGSLFAGPFSETLGRSPVYISTMLVFMLFIMGKALAPDYGAAIAFRFLAGVVGAAPMTVSGGTIGDIWTAEQIPFGLPFTFFTAYSGPILGPVISAFTPEIGFAWADWISMILIGVALVIVVIGFPETYSPVLLEWRAKCLRDVTGDHRYRAPHASGTLRSRLLVNSYRPFTMAWTEPIILVFSFYLILLYFVLFAFLGGYPYIFQYPYGLSTSLTYVIFVAMMPGVMLAVALIPLMWHLTKKAGVKARARGQTTPPEVALYWAMAGASILMPISLFWMAWTCYSEISIWSPIVASGVFGYAFVCIFTTSYMYVISVYQQYAASALGFMTFSRYLIAGALSPAALKMYATIGPHFSLTIVAVVAALMAPVPFVLHRYGHKMRAMSRNAQNKG